MELDVGYQLMPQVLQGILRLYMRPCLLVLIQIGIGHAERLQELLSAPYLLKMNHPSGLESQRVHLRMVYTLPYRIFRRSIEDPINHVPAVVMEHTGTGGDGIREILHATFHGMEFLGLQVFVCLMTAHAVIEFRERRHAQGGVIRGI